MRCFSVLWKWSESRCLFGHLAIFLPIPLILHSTKQMSCLYNYRDPFFPTFFSIFYHRHHEVPLLKPDWCHCHCAVSCTISSGQIDAAAIKSWLVVHSPESADPFLGWSQHMLWSCQRKHNCWVKWLRLSCGCCCATAHAASVYCGNGRSEVTRYVYFSVNVAVAVTVVPAQGFYLLNCSLSISYLLEFSPDALLSCKLSQNVAQIRRNAYPPPTHLLSLQTR